MHPLTMKSRVDFSYAFATPHRLTVALPENSCKTLLDVAGDALAMSWADDDLRLKDLAAFDTPLTKWKINFRPGVDSRPFTASRWQRYKDWLPVLENRYTDPGGTLRVLAAGGVSAMIMRLDLTNTDDIAHSFQFHCAHDGAWGGLNPGWCGEEWERDYLQAGWRDRADRLLFFVLGAETISIPAVNALEMQWTLAPGVRHMAWMIRPYRSFIPDMPALRAHDWQAEFTAACAAWHTLLGRGAQVTIPDAGVQYAFNACLSDLYIMREPIAQGYLATVPGTEGYRALNPFEAGTVAVALDQLGFHDDAELGYRVSLDLQEESGEWSEQRGWVNHMWGASGFKAWTAMEHYRHTRDCAYLERLYPRLAASARWQDGMRDRMRKPSEGERPLTYGFMPRGLGDAGLLDGVDLFGVFLPHNILAVYADRCAVEAAELLGRDEDLSELRRIYQTAYDDLLQAMERGAISEDGYRWLPGVPGKTSGSRWGVLYAVPFNLLARDHSLITGTIRYLETHISEGGLPLNLGWMQYGLWVAITLDNLAEVLLLRDEGDKAVAYLIAALNHGTPLYTWCEERGPRPGATELAGDRQHLWTPVSVVRFLRDALMLEDGAALHLARGIDREWLGSGLPLGMRDGSSYFGDCSFEMTFSPTTGVLHGFVRAEPEVAIPRVVLHLRLPHGLTAHTVNPEAGATLSDDGTMQSWSNLQGSRSLNITVKQAL